MMMLQNPLFQEYNTALSQLLELHQQQNRYHHQQQHQQHQQQQQPHQQQQQHHHHHRDVRHHRGGAAAAAAVAAAAAAGAFQTYVAGGVRPASRDSAESDVLSSSSPRPSKPFTIDAILGLQATNVSGQSAVQSVDPSTVPVAALDFSTSSAAAAHGKKHREGKSRTSYM